MQTLVGIFLIFLGAVSQPASECPHGWTKWGTSCYLFVTHVHNDWTESEYFCHMLHSKLVEIETMEEDNFVQLQAIKHVHENPGTFGFWIGGTDAVVEGEWMWVTTGQNFTYSNWAPGFPDDYRKNEDCAHLYKAQHFEWNDEDCDHRMCFICELT
ncbi:perlucin-like protein [Saccostrea echinata]|uniref:perlucin-like protein n=1 Tax=Saccostrea echinata TaxID=191078 RepID=UPI002A82DB84|nr:perlucin-like protein [Saccostrea echinata]